MPQQWRKEKHFELGKKRRENSTTRRIKLMTLKKKAEGSKRFARRETNTWLLVLAKRKSACGVCLAAGAAVSRQCYRVPRCSGQLGPQCRGFQASASFQLQQQQHTHAEEGGGVPFLQHRWFCREPAEAACHRRVSPRTAPSLHKGFGTGSHIFAATRCQIISCRCKSLTQYLKTFGFRTFILLPVLCFIRK